MATQTFTDLSGNTLDLDSGFVVVRKLQLEGGPANSTCGIEHEGRPDSMMTVADTMGEDDCGELKFGPFLVALPLGAAGVSLRVVGRWNGSPFSYTTGVTDVQHVEFDPPLVIGESPASFTLFVDLTGWFRAGDGSLVDPATALGEGVNAELVHQNIIHSFHAFEDDDHDGHDDQTEAGMH